MTIAVENPSFSYGRTPALREITTRAEAGRITAVIGPNASGKSTLLKCIIGALKPQSGCVSLNGSPVHSLSPKQVAHQVAYVPQRSSVSAAFTVRQVVELGRYALSPSPTRVDRAIERLDLKAIVDRPYPNLSVGQQQRVTLARAIAQLGTQGCLILDEPTSAMDLQHISTCVTLLKELAADGATIVLAMHDVSLAAAIADDVWLLNDGRLVAGGSANEVLTVDRLQQVFHTPFQWIDVPGRSARLVPDIAATNSRTAATIPSP